LEAQSPGNFSTLTVAGYVKSGTGATTSDGIVALGNSSVASSDDSVAIGTNANASGQYSYALGYGATASGHGAMALGIESNATGSSSLAFSEGYSGGASSMAIGVYATALYSTTTAIGLSATAYANDSIAIGSHSYSFYPDTIAIGNLSYADRGSSIAIGYNATAIGSNSTNSVAIGAYATAPGTNSIAFGYNSLATQANSVAIGPNSYAPWAGAVELGLFPNTTDPSGSIWSSTPPQFVVGNGSNATVGSNLLTILSSGYAGFGNAARAPTERVEIDGNLKLRANSNTTITATGTLRWTGSDLVVSTGSSTWTSLLSGLTFDAGLSSNNIPLWSGTAFANSAITNAAGGNIGIGQATPAYNLDVTGSGHFTGLVTAGGGMNLGNQTIVNLQGGNATVPGLSFNGASVTGIFSTADGSLAITTGGTQRLTVDNAGNVLVVKRQGDIVMGDFGNGGGD
jgi:hypothetical protein